MLSKYERQQVKYIHEVLIYPAILESLQFLKHLIYFFNNKYFGHILIPARFTAASKNVDAIKIAHFSTIAHKCNRAWGNAMITKD